MGKYWKCGIRASTGKVTSGRVPKIVGSGQVPEMWDLSDYQKGRIWASTRNVGSGQVPEKWDLGEYQKCGIWASTRNVGSRRVPER